MALLPELTESDLVAFMGPTETPLDDEAWAIELIDQARDLLTIATGLEETPDEPLLMRTARRGILAMADYLYSSAPQRNYAASVMSSERIGSYSYTKATRAVRMGIPTGVTWFDVAVSLLDNDKVQVSATQIMNIPHPSLSQISIDGDAFIIGPMQAAIIHNPYGFQATRQ